jgi:hypothetical protein
MIEFLARRIWWGMLWLMRRPAIRRLQRLSFQLVPEARREKAFRSYRAQEDWAREHGLPLLRFLITIFLISLMFTGIWFLVLEGMQRGWLPGE